MGMAGDVHHRSQRYRAPQVHRTRGVDESVDRRVSAEAADGVISTSPTLVVGWKPPVESGATRQRRLNDYSTDRALALDHSALVTPQRHGTFSPRKQRKLFIYPTSLNRSSMGGLRQMSKRLG